jgi:hypothetical protein
LGTKGSGQYNAASSQRRLGIMLVIAVLEIPVVTTYTTIIYWYSAAESESLGRAINGTVEAPSLPSPVLGNIVGENRR